MQITFRWPVPPNVYFTEQSLLGKHTKLTFIDQEWPATVTNVEWDDSDRLVMLVTLDVEEFGDVDE